MLERAQQTVTEEYRRVSAELDAFDAFEAKVEAIPTDQMATTVGSPGSQTNTMVRASGTGLGASHGGLHAVKRAYESTVMAVAHFEQDYDETYRESVRLEFGANLEGALVDGIAFTRRDKEVLLSAIANAHHERERLLSALATERESLQEATESLSPLISETAAISNQSFETCSLGTIDAYRARVAALETNCTDLVETRQQVLVEQQDQFARHINGVDIPAYLYGELTVKHPIVAGAATVLDRIESIKDRMVGALAVE